MLRRFIVIFVSLVMLVAPAGFAVDGAGNWSVTLPPMPAGGAYRVPSRERSDGHAEGVFNAAVASLEASSRLRPTGVPRHPDCGIYASNAS